MTYFGGESDTNNVWSFGGISYDFPYKSIQMYTVFGWIIEGAPDELRENFTTILLNEI